MFVDPESLKYVEDRREMGCRAAHADHIGHNSTVRRVPRRGLLYTEISSVYVYTDL